MIKINKLKLLSSLTALILLLSVAGYYVISGLFTDYNLCGLFVVPFFYWVLYAIALALVRDSFSIKGLTKFVMAFKVVKMFLSLIAVTIVSFLMKADAVIIMFYFFIFYTVMLVMESLFLMKYKENFKANP